MQNTGISDRTGLKLLKNVIKCSFAAKRMKGRQDQTEIRLCLLNRGEKGGQRASYGVSSYPKSYICHASHCLRSGAETAADILGGLLSSHLHVPLHGPSPAAGTPVTQSPPAFETSLPKRQLGRGNSLTWGLELITVWNTDKIHRISSNRCTGLVFWKMEASRMAFEDKQMTVSQSSFQFSFVGHR